MADAATPGGTSWPTWRRNFPDYAVSAALAIMFATSMTPDPAQQFDQTRILNEIMSRWQPALPWQLVRRPN